MTVNAALQSFFSSFGIVAYPTSALPSDAKFPFLTYEASIGDFDSGDINISANLWFYTESEATPNAKAREIFDRLGRGGVLLPCDGGGLWIKRGTPFSQSLRDESDTTIKRRLINFDVEFVL